MNNKQTARFKRPSPPKIIKYDASGIQLEITGSSIAVGEASPLVFNENAATQIISTKTFDDPVATEEELKLIKKLYDDSSFNIDQTKEISYTFNPDDPWIQTFTGRRFTPTNPNIDAIEIRDIAHALSMQCRFSGHINKFYSVAQHCVLVSYICDSVDALYGLLHDASEAYLLDLASPLKKSGKFDNFKEYEAKLMKVICQRFNLAEIEPISVKNADVQLLVTEARDLMSVKRSDWKVNVNPLPFKIEPWSPDEAEDKFMHRFFELVNSDNNEECYQTYIKNKYDKPLSK